MTSVGTRLTGLPCRALLREWVAPAALFVTVGACALTSSSPGEVPDQLEVGTWGGENVGAIVTEDLVHVHFGCTLGNFPRPAALDSVGRFDVAGTYVLRAFPIQLGPDLPARFSGVVRGNRLTLSVAVDDTVERKLVVLGPATVTLGREPRMGPCPICEKPGMMRTAWRGAGGW
jgi:hypothetical protein